MKIPINWLKEFIDIDISNKDLADKLSLSGFLVEDISDEVYDVEITANRGDALSILGIARDLKATLKKDIKYPETIENFENLNLKLNIRIEDPKKCTRYSYRIISGVMHQKSPEWLQKRLEQIGIRPLSAMIDITNYVMHEMGQPLHAFDYDKISEKKEMVLRTSKKGEEVVTLDNKNHKLQEGVLVIEDNGKLIDLAGIMGGLDSEVSENTKNIILQAAIFDPVSIRKASKALNVKTEASHRYERGVDFNKTIPALDRAAKLYKDIFNAKIGKIEDIVLEKPENIEIELNSERINKLLGTKIPKDEMIKILENLGFENNNLKFKIPSWRFSDIKIWQDLAEEIARIHGLNNINPTTLSKQKPTNLNQEYLIDNKIAEILSENCFIENLSYSFVSKKDLENSGYIESDLIQVKNPISLEYEYLRPSLDLTILKSISKSPWAPQICIFEIGDCISKNFEEKKELIIATNQGEKKLKEILGKLTDNLNIENINPEIINVDQKILDYYKIRRKIAILKINMSEFYKNIKDKELTIKVSGLNFSYKEVSKYPPTIRDFAFITDEKNNAKEFIKEILSVSDNIFLVELFDEFSSDKFGKGKKNLAFHVWFQDLKSSISDEKVNKISQNIIKSMEKEFGATLRDF